VDLSELAYDDGLGAVRKQLLDALVELAGDPAASRAALGISERQGGQLAWNASVWTAPTSPALLRYTGVLYDALGYPSLPATARRRADECVFVASALFGLVGARDLIPPYRLSAGSVLPGVGSLGALWRPALTPVVEQLPGLVLDLRSGGYAGLAPAPGAVRVRVLTEAGKLVSHWNKHYKGVLVRALLCSRADPSDVPGLVRVARRAGLRAERSGEAAIDLIVNG
jgi:cytoplasmic iron level regulating protein YaaA (DUF328/UPF0246 family)